MRRILRDVRDGAILVEYPGASDDEANRAAVSLGSRLRGAREGGLLDAIPGARTLLVVFDPDRLSAERLGRLVERMAGLASESAAASRLLRLPVVYDGEDLAEVALAAGFAPEEFVRRHAAARYRVAFVGFAPGFAYLAGLPPELASPRLPSPRPRVPAGSVAIGGPWTGVYPDATPGGWRLIGRTSARLFDPRADPPALLAPGDGVEFERVGAGEPARAALPARAPVSEGRPFARVVAPGPSTTVQGAGRHGLGSSGMPPGGAMDPASLAFANALAGNAADAPALEIALAGPELEILGAAVLAAGGAEAPIDRNGEPAPLAEAFRVEAGDRLRIGRIGRGARVYLAVRGGIPGDAGRRLAAADVLEAGSSPAASGRTGAPPRDLADDIALRVVLGPESSSFDPRQVEQFLSSPWRVTPESDRRGLRLSGEPLAHLGPPEIPPSGTVPGSIQVPGSGLPIVLGPDGPVTGGYPRIATVVSADLGLLGQARAGAVLRFRAVPLDEALAARRAARSTISLP